MLFTKAKTRAEFIEAVENGDLERVRELIEEGISVFSSVLLARDGDDIEPLHIAVQLQNLQMIDLLIDSGINPDKSLAYGDTEGYRPLHFAAQMNSPELISRLLEKGATIDKGTADPHRLYMTPLHMAAMAGASESVKTLLSAGADASICDGTGSTPATYAQQQGYSSTATLLRSST